MIDVLLGIGAGKLLLSASVATLAWTVQRRVEHPGVAHGLWLLVLAVLLVPAVVAIPVPRWLGTVGGTSEIALSSGAPTTALNGGSALPGAGGWLVALWALGGGAVFGGSLVRSVRFRRQVLARARPVGRSLDALVRELSTELGLPRPPRAVLTDARLSPLVWWAGGCTHLVLPRELLDRLGPDEVRWILAHELAHVRRRDPLVRWVEWAASIVFWWNPVTWWARRELRVQEELCCDELVLTALGDPPHARRMYAGALLTVLEFLSTPPRLGTPAFASGAEARGRTSLIERRLVMIINNSSNPVPSPWLRRAVHATAVLVLPLALVYCGPDAPVGPEAEPQEVELQEIPAGEITEVPVIRLRPSGERGLDLRPEGRVREALLRREGVREALLHRIEAAVASGELTPEQAKARYGWTVNTEGTIHLIPLDRSGTVRPAPEATKELLVELVPTMREIEQQLSNGEITPEAARDRAERVKARLDRGN